MNTGKTLVELFEEELRAEESKAVPLPPPMSSDEFVRMIQRNTHRDDDHHENRSSSTWDNRRR